MLSELAQYEEVFGPLRLLGFLTFRMLMAAATAFVVGLLVAPWMIRKLRALKAAQSLRTAEEVGDLALLHQKKKNTPTMGGLIIFVAITLSTLLWAQLTLHVWIILFVYTVLTGLGFLDDYWKIRKRNSGGVSGRFKLAVQAGVTAVVLVALLLFDREVVLEGVAGAVQQFTVLWVPFVSDPIWTMPIWAAAGLFFLVLAGSSNAINLTDGIDGLAIGCTITVALVYAVMSYATGNVIISDYLLISYVPDGGEMAVICAALLGASMAFLWYNSHPAEVFMGDTGSLALGGMIGTIAFLIHQPFTLILVGGIFVLEAMSVILQVGSFKLRGKRIFRMAPIHHHFELAGWAESKVVVRFWILSLVFALGGLATLKLR